jgi:hypothetical protein
MLEQISITPKNVQTTNGKKTLVEKFFQRKMQRAMNQSARNNQEKIESPMANASSSDFDSAMLWRAGALISNEGLR